MPAAEYQGKRSSLIAEGGMRGFLGLIARFVPGFLSHFSALLFPLMGF